MESSLDRRAHWSAVYAANPETDVSWYQEFHAVSLTMLDAANAGPHTRIIDVGGGAACLVDRLLDRGFRNLAVLDVAAPALEMAKRRLGERAATVTWIEADILLWRPTTHYDVWHDRAVFHFLTEPMHRRAYVATLEAALVPQGQIIIGMFAPEGPDKCSGLPVARYDAEGLARELGAGFELVDQRRDNHVTPTGKVQTFQFCRFRRRVERR